MRIGWLPLLLCVLALGCKSESKAPPPPPKEKGSAPEPPPPPEIDASAPAAAKPAPSPDVTGKLKTALPVIKKMASDAAVVKEVQALNKKKIGLDKIKELDVAWSAATGITDKMKPYLESSCAKALAKYTAELPAIVEAFAMDNQGALVCATSKTTDYWQGDEDKWQKSFAGGKGAEFIDKPKFDDSSQTYSIQVSVPVSDGTNVIGALTVGLAIDKL